MAEYPIFRQQNMVSDLTPNPALTVLLVPVWHHLGQAELLGAQREHLVPRERQAVVVVGVLRVEKLEPGREEAVEGGGGAGDVEYLPVQERLLPFERTLAAHHDHLFNE